jgi:predicted nucleic acid-binding protein
VKVIVDTSVWSLAFRRDPHKLGEQEKIFFETLKDLLVQGRASMLGAVRQEVLSGIPSLDKFKRIETVLSVIEDHPIETIDHIQAADFFNRCRAKGIQGTLVDLLICAVAHRHDYPILATDKDFTHYAKVLPIRLHPVMQTSIPSS